MSRKEKDELQLSRGEWYNLENYELIVMSKGKDQSLFQLYDKTGIEADDNKAKLISQTEAKGNARFIANAKNLFLNVVEMMGMLDHSKNEHDQLLTAINNCLVEEDKEKISSPRIMKV